MRSKIATIIIVALWLAVSIGGTGYAYLNANLFVGGCLEGVLQLGQIFSLISAMYVSALIIIVGLPCLLVMFAKQSIKDIRHIWRYGF